MYWVYILKTKGSKKFYIGVTTDLERRVREHKRGAVKSTKNRFLDLLYVEKFDNKKEAWKREKFLKSGKGREWLKDKFA